MKSKHRATTIAGILAAIGVVAIGVSTQIDGDPETVMNLQAVMAAVGTLMTAAGVGFGGIKAAVAQKEGES